jgi:hypothetical protein
VSNWYFINAMRRSARLRQKAQKAKDEEEMRLWQEEMRRREKEAQRYWQERMRRDINIYIDPSRVGGLSRFSLSVKPTDTIRSIKNKITAIVRYDPQYQVLTIEGIELEDRFTVDDYEQVIVDGSTLTLTTRGGFTLGSERPRSFRFGGTGKPREEPGPTFTLGPPRKEPRGTFTLGPRGVEPRPREPGAFSFGRREQGSTFTLGPRRDEPERTFTVGPRGEEPRPREPDAFSFGRREQGSTFTLGPPRTRVEPGAFSFGGGGEGKKAVFRV